MNPLVSIIIPVYNTGAEAKTLTEKLLKDKYKEIEVILIDDGSKDDSLSILQSIKSEKVRVLTKKNGGASSARNLGIRDSKGDYLLFIDSDDDVRADFITSLVHEIEKPDTALAATAVHYKKLAKESEEDVYLNAFERKDGETMHAFVLRSLLADGRMYPAFNKIFKASIVREHKISFDEALDFAEDTKFVLDYLSHAEGEIRFVLKPLYVYNFGTSTSTVSHSGIIWENWMKSYRNIKKWLGDKPSMREKALLEMLRAKWRVSCFRAAQAARKAKK
jgi:glycosyltransferase EpsJ